LPSKLVVDVSTFRRMASTPSRSQRDNSRQVSNEAMNLTVRPVTRLAGLLLCRDSQGREQGARPSRPAGYRWR
jgi:hypothetical protein